jgi:hypothetical protein
MLDMCEENFGQLCGKVVDTEQTLRHGGIDWVGAEIKLFFFNSLLHRNPINYILL